MYRPLHLCVGLLCVSLAGAAVAGEAPARCGRLVGELTLDGSLADPIWRGTPPLTGFQRHGKPAGEQSEVRTCYDADCLYLIATCRENDVSVICSKAKGLDVDLSRDDRVDLILRLPSGEQCVLTASAGGALHDAMLSGSKGDGGWSSGAKTGVQVFKHAWGVEVAVPLKRLGLEAKAGQRLELNVARRRVAAGEVSWLRPEGSFAEVVFAGPPAWAAPLAPVRPRAGVLYSAADIENARANVHRFAWARGMAQSLVGRAEGYLREPAAHNLSFMPPKGATFAYGFAGCPKCSRGWPRFGRGMCSFDKPGKVTCRHCEAVLPADGPQHPHYDPGDGVTIEGHRYYFKGVWHAWVINQYKAMLAALSHAYALSGDERFAERAALIFDAMATLAPSTVGPRDNMRPHQKKVGIFHYYTQQLTENLRSYLLYYDLIYHSKAMDQVSPTNSTGFSTTQRYTIRQNIEKNIFLDTWDVEMNTRAGRLPSLHNHTSATVRAMMGVGLVCGEPDLIRWGIEAAYKFINNTADPEGQYYETSGAGYNQCGRNCNASFADMLWNYDPRHYDDPSKFPQPQDYPQRIKLYRLPRLRLLLDNALYDMDCAGHIPRYGDAGPDVGVVTDPVGQWGHYRFRWAFTLYRTAGSDADRRLYYRKMLAASRGQLDRWLARSLHSLFWFQPLADPPKYDPTTTFNRDRSSLWGQRATAILRQGEGRDRMALIMVGGAIFPHGNDDTLHVSLYSRGQMLTHDVAYDLYGRPVHMGWACRSIAHCTVTVDERGGPPIYRGGPNANVTGFCDAGCASFVAMAAGPTCWQSQPDVRRYDRSCALVAVPGGGGYFVDLFEVEGGKQHDYSFHGQVTENGQGFTLKGAQPKPVANAWTLAGLSGHQDATFDAPGRSWGERVQPGNRIRNLGIPGEKVGYFGWYPPPKNGYGFLYDVAAGPAQEHVTASWVTKPERDIHMALHLFPGPATTLITAKGPDLSGRSVIPFVIARRQGKDLSSSFLAAVEGYTKQPQLTSVQPAAPLHGMRGLVLAGRGGWTDRVWCATDGRFALVRTQGDQATALSLHQVGNVEHAGVSLRLSAAALQGTVAEVDYEGHWLRADIKPHNPRALVGRTLLVSRSTYACNSGYRIASCRGDGAFGFGLVGFRLAVADWQRTERPRDKTQAPALVSSTPMPLAWSSGRPRTTGLLDGKLAVSADGKRKGTIARFLRPQKFQFDPGATIQKGDTFSIYDVQPGDHVRVPMTAALRRLDDGTWELTATCDVAVRLSPNPTEFRDRDGHWQRLTYTGRHAAVALARTANGRTVLR